MKLIAVASFLLLVGLSTSTPTGSKDDDLVISQQYFLDNFVKYIGQHDIVNIMVPLNKLNFDDNEDSDEETEDSTTVFFVEADIKENGERVDQGLYILKNNQTKKLLDHGRDAAAANDDSKVVYFGAADGLYTFNDKDVTAEKYGTLTDSIIQIAIDNQTSTIYFVTEDHKLYTVAEEGNKKNQVEGLDNVKEIAIDFMGNVFYYDSDKQLHIYNQEGSKKFEKGLPTSISNIKLIRPPFALDEGVLAVVNDELYVLYANATVDASELRFAVKPTAYAPEATLLLYMGFDKKIYEFDILSIVLASELQELKDFLSDKEDEIKTIASKPRNSF